MKEIIGYKLNGVVDRKTVDRFLGSGISVGYCGDILLSGKSKHINDFTEEEKAVYFTRGHVGGCLVQKCKEAKVLDLWFEPIYRQEWEILSFRKIEDGNTIWEKKDNGDFKLITGNSCEKFFLDRLDKYEIYSIKRTSDGEVFTLGEDVFYCNAIRPITLFSVVNNIIAVHFPEDYVAFEEYGFKQIKRAPLFTTQDGKAIYNGDTYFHVCEDNTIVEFDTAPEWVDYSKDNSKSFSTKEAAEQYVNSLQPKVLVTTEDGVQVTDPKQKLYSLCCKAQWQTGEFSAGRINNKGYEGDILRSLSPFWKHFSTKETRDEYIINHKPLFSLDDIVDLTIVPAIGTWFSREELQSLREVAIKKSGLNVPTTA